MHYRYIIVKLILLFLLYYYGVLMYYYEVLRDTEYDLVLKLHLKALVKKYFQTLVVGPLTKVLIVFGLAFSLNKSINRHQ